MTVSRLDQFYRSILVSKFFTKGWGKPENIKKLYQIRQSMRDRDKCYALVSKNHPIQIDKEEEQSDCFILSGHFKSPFAEHLPGVVPEASENAYFQMLLPKTWKTSLRPLCLHLAGTGDHYFWRRRTFMAKPLLKEYGIVSLIFDYMARGNLKINRSNLHNVSDIFVMGGCLALESIALFNWCERQGFGPLGITGISMGGHMACIAAGVWPKPVVLVPCLSWTTASCVFTQGVMSACIPWQLLQNQYFTNDNYHGEIRKLIGPLTKKAQEDSNHFEKHFDLAKMNSGTITPHEDSLKQLKNDRLDRMFNLPTRLASTKTESSAEQRGKTDSLSKKDLMTGEALQFMNSIMDEFTHLANYDTPVDTSLVIVIAAKDDAYVLRDGVEDLTHLWKGAELRLIDSGHVAAFIFNQKLFRKAISDGFERLTQKYNLENNPVEARMEK
uniref:Uncharacterized protein n=1 Tax=Strigamia maritima TaxID=126957 RepID=T1IPK7_STRMM